MEFILFNYINSYFFKKLRMRGKELWLRREFFIVFFLISFSLNKGFSSYLKQISWLFGVWLLHPCKTAAPIWLKKKNTFSEDSDISLESSLPLSATIISTDIVKQEIHYEKLDPRSTFSKFFCRNRGIPIPNYNYDLLFLSIIFPSELHQLVWENKKFITRN